MISPNDSKALFLLKEIKKTKIFESFLAALKEQNRLIAPEDADILEASSLLEQLLEIA